MQSAPGAERRFVENVENVDKQFISGKKIAVNVGFKNPTDKKLSTIILHKLITEKCG